MHILFLLACGSQPVADKPHPVEADHVEAKKDDAHGDAHAEADDSKLRGIAKTTLGMLPENAFDEAHANDAKVVALGKQLYFDKRLSKDDTVSCNSCHDLARYGVDNEPTSPGVGGTRGGRNSPTVYNAAFHVAQFWDGREPDVEAQALGPILNPVEMQMADGDEVVAKLSKIPAYKTAFEEAFEDGLTYSNIGQAIGAFERTLVTPAPFDKWLAGDDSAMTAEQKAGFDTFMSNGCTACHNGPTVGGTMYQKLGLVNPWDLDDDVGRAEVTKNDAEKQFFKVPSLRNIEKTAPYYHKGNVETLDDAIVKMAYHQLGKELKPEEVTSIKSFLSSLTGELDPEKVEPPTLP